MQAQLVLDAAVRRGGVEDAPYLTRSGCTGCPSGGENSLSVRPGELGGPELHGGHRAGGAVEKEDRSAGLGDRLEVGEDFGRGGRSRLLLGVREGRPPADDYLAVHDRLIARGGERGDLGELPGRPGRLVVVDLVGPVELA